MKNARPVWFLFVLFVLLGLQGTLGSTLALASEELLAIDVLLEPDQQMVDAATQLNARLRGNFPAGYALDATHAPHITLVQRFIRARDLGAATTAIEQVMASAKPEQMALQASSIEYALWNGRAVTVIMVERTPELMQLHAQVTAALKPFTVEGGNAAAFVGSDINAETVKWVEDFVPTSSGEHYLPHVTAGVADEAFVKQLKAEPFHAFSFKFRKSAIYQLGNFGTAAKLLWPPQKSLPPVKPGAASRSIRDIVQMVIASGTADFIPQSGHISTLENHSAAWTK